MKCILIGHPFSQIIVPASKYLTSKYMPGFEFVYLNYSGEINGWAKYLRGFLDYFTDKHVIVALDDYLIADSIDMWKYKVAALEAGLGAKCVKLCRCSEEEQEEYPVTTQYCIWDREFLVWLLTQPNIRTPWEFELNGSSKFKELDEYSKVVTCLNYFTNSSLSSRWEGIRLDGLKEEDINYMKEHGILP